MLQPSDWFQLMPQLWTDVVLLEQKALAAVSHWMDDFARPLSQTALEGT